MLENVVQQVDLEKIVLQDLRHYALDCVVMPTIVAIAIMKAKEVLVGKVNFQPTRKQVQVAKAVGMVEVQLQVVVVKVVTFIIVQVEKIVEVCFSHELIEVVAVCKVVLDLAFMISYLGDEVAVVENDYPKMDRDLQEDYLGDDLKPVDL